MKGAFYLDKPVGVILFYKCCDVAHTIKCRTLFSQETRTTLCWACGKGFPTKVMDLEPNHPIKGFYQVATMIRPTDKTPPWRI